MKKNLKFSVIVNLNASGGKNLSLINEVIKLLKSDHEVKVFKTYNKDQAKTVFKKLPDENFDRIVIAGGDGSICFAVNELIQNNGLQDKIVGFIPAGSTNILQIETKISSTASNIYDVLVSDKTKKINLVKINKNYFILMAGIGFDSKVVESIGEKSKKYLGKIIFIIKGLQNFIFLNNEKMKVEVDGEKFSASWILCTNSKYYAGPYSITQKTNIFDKKVIVYIVKNLTRFKILNYLWLIYIKGDISSAKSIITRDFQTLKIETTKNKLLTQIDGEKFSHQNNITIQKSEKFLNLLIP